MSAVQVKLNEQNSQRADELARQTGKTAEELVNDAFERFAEVAAQDDEEERRKFLAWREAAMKVAGIWKDRTDLPDFEELRKSWDRNVWDME